MKFGIIGNTSKSAIEEVTRNLYAYLRAKKLTFVFHDQLGKWFGSTGVVPPLERTMMCTEEDLPDRCDILIALGGDGTMLFAARIVGHKGVPILGINLGKLGFLAEFSVNEIQQCIDDIISGNYVVEERMALEAQSAKDDRCYYALNEIVIDRGASARVVDLETEVNDEYLVTYAADGIIFTTPTGSTAYSLATGGPIVDPRSKVITINPIAPHTLTARPVIVPEDSVIRVAVNSVAKSIHIAADGQV